MSCGDPLCSLNQTNWKMADPCKLHRPIGTREKNEQKQQVSAAKWVQLLQNKFYLVIGSRVVIRETVGTTEGVSRQDASYCQWERKFVSVYVIKLCRKSRRIVSSLLGAGKRPASRFGRFNSEVKIPMHIGYEPGLGPEQLQFFWRRENSCLSS